MKYIFYQIEHQLYFWSNDILFWGCLSRKLVVILIFIFVEENKFIKSLIVLFRLFFIHNCLVFLSFTGITTSQTFVSFGQSFSFVYKTFSNCKKKFVKWQHNVCKQTADDVRIVNKPVTSCSATHFPIVTLCLLTHFATATSFSRRHGPGPTKHSFVHSSATKKNNN